MKFPILFFLMAVSTAFAQTPSQNWVPQEIASLSQIATSRTEFSLDHNMVVLASKVDQEDESLRRVVAGVDGISVHRFRFGAGAYDPQILNALRQDYHSAGWQHLSDAHDKYGFPKASDLWLHFQNNTIRNIAFLVADANQVSFVSISGSISPVDLLHLAGHFGIPRIEGGVSAPAPGATVPPPTASAPPPPANDPPQQPDDYRYPNGSPNSAPRTN